MFYPKNVPNIERIIRIVLGLAMTSFAFFGTASLPLQIILLASAVILVATGFIGWCPMCAMVGRKIKSSKST